MRTKPEGRIHQRTVGAVEPTISNLVRKQNTSLIPTNVATPLVWIDPDEIDMSAVGALGSFTDRMGVSWSVTASCSGPGKLQAAINGRNALQMAPTNGSAVTCVQSTNITTAADVTVFWVFRDGYYNSTFPAAFPVPVQKNTVNSEWLWLMQSTRTVTWRYKNGVADRSFSLQNDVGRVYVCCGIGSSSDAAVYVNSTTASASGAPASTLASATTPIYYGANGPSPTNNPTCLQAGDLIVYGSALSTDNRNAVLKYLGRKYGVTIS